jgi:phage terminase large subunit
MAKRTVKKSCKSYYDVKDSQKRFNICQGGSRSGKTYSILQFLVEICYLNQNANATITIARKTFPTIRKTVMKDFFEILVNFGVYNAKFHSKTNHTYTLFGNIVQFVSLDDPQKLRGLKQDILYINEANGNKLGSVLATQSTDNQTSIDRL